jgi:hypothetical protein
MPYQYGMQNSPAGGNGLGGLPKKQTTPQSVNFTRIVTAGSGTIVPPANAKYMRVAAIGGGGSGNSNGGGGGGCAASKIVPASPIAYAVGLGGQSGNSGGNTTASFGGYALIGGGGSGGNGTGSGGAGAGGDYNFSGGNGGTSGVDAGGGAAGPNGNGGNGAAGGGVGTFSGAAGVFSGAGWGSGGGSGGNSSFSGSLVTKSGGGGVGGRGGALQTAVVTNSPNTTWGEDAPNVPSAGQASSGGVMGGGSSRSDYAGGVGGIVVEWFYD